MRAIPSGLLLFVLLLPAAVVYAYTADLRLTFGDISTWQEKSFTGRTAYSLVQSNGKTVLQAHSVAAASGLYHKVSVNAADLPRLKWSWKIERTLEKENPYRKDGDDFAARIYVIFPGQFFWQTRALVYVWSDKLPVGTILPNAFSGNAAVIAIESGNMHAGTWRHESRNYAKDYRTYFHDTPPNPSAIAVMTDTDNTASAVTAWYGDIIFSSDGRGDSSSTASRD